MIRGNRVEVDLVCSSYLWIGMTNGIVASTISVKREIIFSDLDRF